MAPGGDSLSLGNTQRRHRKIQADLPVAWTLCVSNQPAPVGRSITEIRAHPCRGHRHRAGVSLFRWACCAPASSWPVHSAGAGRPLSCCMYIFDVGLHKISAGGGGRNSFAPWPAGGRRHYFVEMMAIKMEQGWAGCAPPARLQLHRHAHAHRHPR